jgi:hypothetical protein
LKKLFRASAVRMAASPLASSRWLTNIRLLSPRFIAGALAFLHLYGGFPMLPGDIDPLEGGGDRRQGVLDLRRDAIAGEVDVGVETFQVGLGAGDAAVGDALLHRQGPPTRRGTPGCG